jgi:hypothetical protein
MLVFFLLGFFEFGILRYIEYTNLIPKAVSNELMFTIPSRT